ncbi:MAG: DUF6263 family protein [Planctomycetota bacterium]|nr:DUF6263 family protein [Planctomycetota bacterium]
MIRILSVVLCSVALCGLARAEDKLSLGVKKGQSVSYSSQRTSDVKFERDGESSEMKSDTSAQFTLSVKDVAKDGKITLEVNYTALKLSNNRDDGFEFDSSKKAEKEGGQAAYLRKVVASTITVEVTSDGKIAGIKGFPTYEQPRAEGEEGQRRGFRGSRGPMRSSDLVRDLSYVLGSGIQGKELKDGELYRMSTNSRAGSSRGRPDRGGSERGRGRREESIGSYEVSFLQDRPQERPERRRPEGGAEGQERRREGGARGQDEGGRSRGRGGFSSYGSTSLKYTAAKDSASHGFEVVRPGRGEDDEPTSLGQVSFSKKDGLLESLQYLSKRSSERDSFSYSSTSTHTISRVKAKAKGKAKGKGKKEKKSKAQSF